MNYGFLRRCLELVGPVKSLKTFLGTNTGKIETEAEQCLNSIINNWYDIEFCRWLALTPENTEQVIRGNPFFECIGHSYEILWRATVDLLASALDPEYRVLPNPSDWQGGFRELEHRRIEGWYHGSPIRIPPFGGRAIFEGQARFSQLQLLYFGSPANSSWDVFERLGMLGGIYTTAFDFLLDVFGEDVPETPGSPLVALFLLICDIAMNPTEGFPLAISDFTAFRENVDPGVRFVRLCHSAAMNKTRLLGSLHEFSRDEYAEVSEMLVAPLGWPPPLSVADTLQRWGSVGTVAQLLAEDSESRFKPTHLPVRLFAARFLAFQRGKFEHPELLVWPGAYSGREQTLVPIERIVDTFAAHEPLFVADDSGAVRPNIIAGRDREAMAGVFAQFYAFNATYQLVREWIIRDGPFELDFDWLAPQHTPAEIKEWAEDEFHRAFGVHLGDFALV